nr:uncharacterized protein LOC111984844 [Quercus suber]
MHPPYFVGNREALWETIEAGNRTKCAAFSTKGWINLMTKFCDKISLNCDKDQLKSRWDVLKGDWRVWEKLKNLDIGLGWDAVKGTIDASDDWWDWELKQGHTSQSRSSRQKRTSESIPSQKKKKKIGGVAMLDDRISQLINVCQNKSEGTSRESPSSIDNVMEIVRALPEVESTFVVQASYILLKRSRREMFLTFKEPESQLE